VEAAVVEAEEVQVVGVVALVVGVVVGLSTLT
jgi:hypothetical protein